jgi:AcrR family transcriptional regulator
MATKAQRTHERLQTAAIHLFAINGYDSTSVAEIAAAAGVSEMTFFRYFRAKENVLLEDPYDPVMAAAISAQPSHHPPLVRAVAGIRGAWHELSSSATEEVRVRVRIIAQSPTLRSSLARTSADTEYAIAAAIGGDAFQARVVASVVMAALNTALLEWSARDDAELGGMVDAALDVLAVDHG